MIYITKVIYNINDRVKKSGNDGGACSYTRAFIHFIHLSSKSLLIIFVFYPRGGNATPLPALATLAR